MKKEKAFAQEVQLDVVARLKVCAATLPTNSVVAKELLQIVELLQQRPEVAIPDMPASNCGKEDQRKHNNAEYSNSETKGCLVCAPNSQERRKPKENK